MAVVVSGFQISRLSLDDHQSHHPNSSSPFNKSSRSALPEWIEHLSRRNDEPQYKRKGVKPPVATDHATDCTNRPASRIIPHHTISQTLPASIDEGVDSCTKQKTRFAFQKWMGSLQKRAKQRSIENATYSSRVLPWVWGLQGGAHSSRSIHSTHCKSSSGSSFRFFSAVRSASTSFAGSRTETALSQCQSHMDFEIEALKVPIRCFDDDKIANSRQPMDRASVERALQRRKILQELIFTEKSYLGDIRFLLNVYVTMLASLPCSHPGLRRSVNQNLCEILQLHEEILSEVGRAVSLSDGEGLGRSWSTELANPGLAKGERSESTRFARDNIERAAHIDHPPGSFAPPQVVAEVSRVFEKKLSRFFIYQEYGAKYNMIIQDIATVDEVLPGWNWNQRGLEALSVLLHSSNVLDCHSRRASTLKDLLVKPIQRICRYPLIFGELLKYTPASDCPNAHMAASSVLARFREANFEINRATNDPYMTRILARTWLLQDRLVFPNTNFDSVAKDRVRSLGRVRLCGTLHICWQNNNKVDGQYLICLLYHDVLCLAYAGKADPIYILKACISLHEISVENADNGRGLQCHSAPFSWKIIFESSQRLFEIIMTACSPKEEFEWRSRLSSTPVRQKSEVCSACPFLDMNITSFGATGSKWVGNKELGGPTNARLSARRATTSCPKPSLYQVILKNTSECPQSNVSNTTSMNIGRSHSLLSTRTRVSILSPPRMERARLEALLADVWSREILPFSAVSTRTRSEKFVRTSASTVMRKFSVVSIANSLARKTEGLRQRLSFEDPCRPPTTQTAWRDNWQPGRTSDVRDEVSGLKENCASSTPATRSSWSPDRKGLGASKFDEASFTIGSWGFSRRENDRRDLGLRGIFK